MNFRTEIKLGTAPFEINYQHEVMLVGSCFSGHMGDKLKEMKMNVSSNPFGISFNPHSIAHSISRIIENKEYSAVENFNNLYFRLLIGVGLVFFQQFTGQPNIIYYAADIFRQVSCFSILFTSIMKYFYLTNNT